MLPSYSVSPPDAPDPPEPATVGIGKAADTFEPSVSGSGTGTGTATCTGSGSSGGGRSGGGYEQRSISK